MSVRPPPVTTTSISRRPHGQKSESSAGREPVTKVVLLRSKIRKKKRHFIILCLPKLMARYYLEIGVKLFGLSGLMLFVRKSKKRRHQRQNGKVDLGL